MHLSDLLAWAGVIGFGLATLCAVLAVWVATAHQRARRRLVKKETLDTTPYEEEQP